VDNTSIRYLQYKPFSFKFPQYRSMQTYLSSTHKSHQTYTTYTTKDQFTSPLYQTLRINPIETKHKRKGATQTEFHAADPLKAQTTRGPSKVQYIQSAEAQTTPSAGAMQSLRPRCPMPDKFHPPVYKRESLKPPNKHTHSKQAKPPTTQAQQETLTSPERAQS
jgi:hypothetical protein